MKPSFSRGYFNFPSKREGATHWLLERLTGLVLMGLSGWFLYQLFFQIPPHYEGALAWLSCPCHGVLFSLLMAFILWHSYLCITVVIEDYVHIAFWYSTALFVLKTIMVLSTMVLSIAFYHIIF